MKHYANAPAIHYSTVPTIHSSMVTRFYSFTYQTAFVVFFLLLLTTPVAAQSGGPRKIAYTYGNTSSIIKVINEDGTGQTQLTTGGYTDENPTWSPDGTQIAFHSNRSAGRFNIYRMNADGTGLVPLTDFALPFSSRSPSWSPDGTKIVFTSDRDGSRKSEIWVMNADGTNLIKLTTNLQLGSDLGGPFYSFDRNPSWSPDGTKIAFSTNRDGIANPEIYLMNADGSNQTRLTNNSAQDEVPSWLPDGQHISFFSRGEGRNGIYVIDTNGANDHQLTDSGYESAWSPDGQRIATTDFDPQAMSAMAIYLADSNGSNRIKLTNNGTIDSRMPAWQRTGGPAPPPPPAPNTYTVTGKIGDSSLNPNNPPGVPGITVTLSGSISATTSTDADGKFSFTGLPGNGTFTVTPSTADWGIFPTNRTFSTTLPLIGFVGRNIDLSFSASPIFEEFITATFTATEGSDAIITVVRQGFVQGTSTIHYSASNGTAEAGTDYVATSGTLTFNPSEAMKSFSIPIIYDKTLESGETINLTLNNPTGSTSRGRQTAVLTINDPAPTLVTEGFTSQAGALNAQSWLRDPFPLTTTFLGQTFPTRVALFARFVDLLPGEDTSAVVVTGRDASQVVHQLPVEAVVSPQTVGNPGGGNSLTQINIRLPGDLPSGDLFINISLRGLTSSLFRIRIN